MRKCSGSVPEEFREKVKDKDMERILDYNSARTKTGNIQFAVFTGVLILIIFGNVLGPIISKSECFPGCGKLPAEENLYVSSRQANHLLNVR